MVRQCSPRSQPFRDRSIKRLVRSLLLFATTLGVVLTAAPGFSASVPPTAKPDSASRLGQPLQTDYASYCHAENAAAKPICGGVGEGEATPVSRTDFVLEPENAPLEPIVLYQYDKTILLQGGL